MTSTRGRAHKNEHTRTSTQGRAYEDEHTRTSTRGQAHKDECINSSTRLWKNYCGPQNNCLSAQIAHHFTPVSNVLTSDFTTSRPKARGANSSPDSVVRNAHDAERAVRKHHVTISRHLCKTEDRVVSPTLRDTCFMTIYTWHTYNAVIIPATSSTS